MSYQVTVNSIRSAAQAVNSNGTFRHGRRIDASNGSINDASPIIHLYPFQTGKSTDPDFVDSNTILIGFWKQDRADTSPEERESIISEMDELSDLFIEQLAESKLLRLTQITKEPQYQMMAGMVSGYAVRFTLENFTPCG